MKISVVVVYGLHLRAYPRRSSAKSVIKGKKIAGKILLMLEDIAAKDQYAINTISRLKKF